MANDADAAERTVNGSTTVLPPQVAQVPELCGAAAAPHQRNGDRRPADTTSADGGDDPDHDVSTSTESVVSDDEDQAGEQAEVDTDTDDDDEESGRRAGNANAGIRLALVVGVVTVLALAGLDGWFGYGIYQAHQTEKLHNQFLAIGTQGALDLTTINYTEAEVDIQRILDSSTGQFYDDFSKRAGAFVDVVKQSQAKTDGKIVEAGLESSNAGSARVLVAVLVTTSNKGVTDERPRHWRMRIDVQKVGNTVKVANVGFVP